MIEPKATFIYQIKKSKFIGFRFDIGTKIEFNEILDYMRKKYNDATHVCYAYIVGNGSNAGMSDDGEPSGTVGKPMLNFLQIKKQTNTCVFAVRYYGGIKLGKGGLTRAYISSIKDLYND